MRAAWYAKNGAADEVLTVGEQPIVEPGAGDVQIKLAFSGINPSDVKSRQGSRPVRAGIVIPHSDGAGVIAAVGSGVDRARIGERVWIWNGQYNRPLGTAAQYITLPSEQAVLLADHTSLEAGACMGIPGLTAYRAVELAQIDANDIVLIIGGTSAVGFYAAQMARARGARVISTVGSLAKAQMMKNAGFDEVILYKTESVADRVRTMTAGVGVNAIIDMDFATSAGLVDQGVLAAHGRFVCYGSNVRGDVPLNFTAWMPRSISLHFFLVYELTLKQRQGAVEGLNALLQANVLQHVVQPAYAFEKIVAAHQAVESGEGIGNIVLDCVSHD